MNTTAILNDEPAWSPITISELFDEIFPVEERLIGKLYNFWKLIKITPEKWQEKKFGEEGGGFWVVAICGRRVIWFNDIEGGFNISDYNEYGIIADYWCNQSKLDESVQGLYNLIDFGDGVIARENGPHNLF